MIDLISIVKNNLPSNVTITREPYKARLSDDLLYIHDSIGCVFHVKTTLDNGDYFEDMLFVSDSINKAFHNAISLFRKPIEELCKRCYWVGENDIVKEGLKI
jgi:hypothetical protein